MVDLAVAVERWPIAGGFRISRETRTEAVVVVVTLTDGAVMGRGECVPYARYGETVDGVAEALRGCAGDLAAGLDRAGLRARLPAGAARNALDAALWDLEAKRSGRRVWDLAGVAPPPAGMVTAETLSIDTPEAMRPRRQGGLAGRPAASEDQGGGGRRAGAGRGGARRGARVPADRGRQRGLEPGSASRLPCPIWPGCASIWSNKPLPAAQDDALRDLDGPPPVPLCADESAHSAADVARLAGLYQAINIKLDKTGGLTEALVMADAAEAAGLTLMVGCMVGTFAGHGAGLRDCAARRLRRSGRAGSAGRGPTGSAGRGPRARSDLSRRTHGPARRRAMGVAAEGP